MEIPGKHRHRPNLKRNRFKFLHLGPTELPVPKLTFLSNPRAEIGNSDDASPEILSRQQSLPSFKSDRHPVPKLWASLFLVPKMGQCPKSTMPRQYPEFYWLSNRILKIWAKFTKPTSCESASKFGAQKREFTKKHFQQTLVRYNPSFFAYRISIYICNRSCPENRFCTITHCLLNQPFQIIIQYLYPGRKFDF